MEPIKKFREEINKIDKRIIELIQKRAILSRKIGEEKRKRGESVYSPERENWLLKRLKNLNLSPLPAEGVQNIFREIISLCRRLEAPLKIAYLGPEATFTHLAAQKHFGSSTQFIPLKSIGEVFLEVEKLRANFGVVPVENTIEGAVAHTLDCFLQSPLKICAEAIIAVRCHLLSRVKKEEIKKVYSHPHSLAQCRRWLEENLPYVKIEEVPSTGFAAKLAAREKGAAAIAGEVAAQAYGLKIVEENIQDKGESLTRFLIIGREIPEPSGEDKTSVVFSLKDEVGALYNMLLPFKKYRINLTMIESRPSREVLWDYYFFLDMEGHIKEERIKKALEEVKEKCVFLKVLGSYPRAI